MNATLDNMKTNTMNIDENGRTIKIAIDMHLRSYRVVRQSGHLAPQPPQKFAPPKFYPWLEKQLEQGDPVAVCYEAGCFGYEPARRMRDMGARVYVIAPQDWDEKGKRQVNDKVDAVVMCRRLHNYLAGDSKALSIVHIPTPEQEERRACGRLREQLRRQMRRMQAMGRSLLLQREIVVKGRWWTRATWASLPGRAPSWVIEQLSTWKEIIELIERKAKEVEKHMEDAAPARLLRGEGKLTHELFERELIDPHRFSNGRQVGNYFGLCPSESSSGNSRRLGSITKRGNPRLRWLVIQMAWRVMLFQPRYHAAQKWLPILRDKKLSSSARKKAIVALARRLAVDLWRISTGRTKPEDLGLVLGPHEMAAA